MKTLHKKWLTLGLAAAASVAVVPVVQAEVSASVGAANMYYWRGLDLGGGAALSADVSYSQSGFFVGAWTSSGDEVMGTEYDLYAGYGGEFGDFNYSLSVISYNYADPKEGEPVAPGDLTEVALGLGYGPFAATYYDNVAGNSGYTYLTLALEFEKFTLLYGQHEDDLAHLDLTWNYNKNLSFTLGKVVDDAGGNYPDDAKFIVSLSLPIDFD